MIRLRKGPKPQILVDNESAWTGELLDFLNRTEQPPKRVKGRYNNPQIKMALVRETNGKCAYCESKFEHISYGDIEHVTPKSDEPTLTFEWTNLTVACDVCNTNKGTTFYDQIVDPYVDEPSDFIRFYGPLILALPGSDKGRITEALLNLNRSALLERRAEHLARARDALETIARTKNVQLKTVLRNDFAKVWLIEVAEFCAMARAYHLQLGAGAP